MPPSVAGGLGRRFWDRANASLRASDIAPGRYAGTCFENEKAGCPNAFSGFLEGQRAEAVKFMQQDDSEPWSRKLTLGGGLVSLKCSAFSLQPAALPSASRLTFSHCTEPSFFSA